MSEISIQNKNHFKLCSPKGRIINENVYSAYKKSTLSSIPRKVEIVLVDSNHKKILNSLPVTNQSESSKRRLTRSESSILLSGAFASRKQRFDDYKDFLSKYSPGPGQYDNTSTLDDNRFRYQSLFSKPSNCSLKKSNSSLEPGPGQYDVVLGTNARNINLASKGERFKEIAKQDIGPGSYFKINSFKYNNKHPSSFFMHNITRRISNDQRLEKYIKMQREKDYEVPGPGMYNVKGDFDHFDSSTKNVKNIGMIQKILLNKTLIPEDMKKQIKHSKHESDVHWGKGEYWKGIESKKEIRSPFISKSKKISIYDDIMKRHIPGPCYYQQDVIIKKKNNQSMLV